MFSISVQLGAAGGHVQIVPNDRTSALAGFALPLGGGTALTLAVGGVTAKGHIAFAVWQC